MRKAVLLGMFLVGCGYHTHTLVVNNTTVIVVDNDDDAGVADAGETKSAPADAGAPDSGHLRHHDGGRD